MDYKKIKRNELINILNDNHIIYKKSYSKKKLVILLEKYEEELDKQRLKEEEEMGIIDIDSEDITVKQLIEKEDPPELLKKEIEIIMPLINEKKLNYNPLLKDNVKDFLEGRIKFYVLRREYELAKIYINQLNIFILDKTDKQE